MAEKSGGDTGDKEHCKKIELAAKTAVECSKCGDQPTEKNSTQHHVDNARIQDSEQVSVFPHDSACHSGRKASYDGAQHEEPLLEDEKPLLPTVMRGNKQNETGTVDGGNCAHDQPDGSETENVTTTTSGLRVQGSDETVALH